MEKKSKRKITIITTCTTLKL